ncbi:AraC family transcriptional regulator [Chryseobacterium carnipullorum]|uniref:AraC family transcriptional regulator n=1 Tax=Chryseobacterium carnipullorum TaxID=1124835 RepID=A0A376EIK7_CHRCU|nr:AraC family transcriptional regulator [Chryseobacterium carnipullorum]AZA47342.1 AraC family transcriptional regulator [Chryseobacterium carnipullorum]AZA66684.1 AraC family transcriptional regulator [Chryseobacterium carnipullorum]STD09558.1 DNA-binding transcriptional activator FeaR [Chryseobacterium carnipullorum]
MTFGQQMLFFFSAVGAFNGLLLGIYLLSVKKLKYIPDFFLGLILLTLSSRVGISVGMYFYPDLPRIIPHLGMSALFFTGPALYYYIRSSFLQEKFDLKQCRTSFGFLTLVLGIVGLVYLFFPVTWDQYFGTFIYTVWSVFVLLSVYQYYIFSKQKAGNPNQFILPVLISNAIIFLAYQLISTGWVQIYCAGGSLVFSFVLYANFLIIFSKKNDQELVKEVPRYTNKKISEELADSFVSKLEQLMNSEELYKNPNLKLSDLATQMKMSAHQLSQLLNDNLGKSFSTYINEYRISEACEKIENGSFLKIEEIGYEVGFNSKSTFFSTFKKIKNTTPLLYKQSKILSDVRFQSSEL